MNPTSYPSQQPASLASKRENLETELRDWIALFNESENAHPSKRIHAIHNIRQIRVLIKKGAVHA